MQATRIYLGNIPFETTQNELEQMLADYHPIAVTIALDRKTNQPRGFAHATLRNQADAERAVLDLDGKTFQGRRLVCAPATHRGTPNMSLRKDTWDSND